MRIFDGNYIQTSKSNYNVGVYNFSGKNSFLQAEEAKSGSGTSYGIACTGARGWPILSVDSVNSRLKLSGNLDALIRLDSAHKMTNAWSVALDDCADTACMMIADAVQTEESAGWVMFSKFSNAIASLSAYDEEKNIWLYENDDNAFYCPSDPSTGVVNIANFYANHAEGGSTRAIGKYTHAEGR